MMHMNMIFLYMLLNLHFLAASLLREAFQKKTTEIVKLVLPLLTPPPPPVIGKKNVGIVV